MICSAHLQTFATPHHADAKLLRTVFKAKQVHVGCCVAKLARNRPVFEGSAQALLDALLERADQVKSVVITTALECPIRFHQALMGVQPGTAVCFVFPDAAVMEESLFLLRPDYTEGELRSLSFVSPLQSRQQAGVRVA